MEEVASTTLADIIRRNTHVDNELQDNAFLIPQDRSPLGMCLMGFFVSSASEVISFFSGHLVYATDS